MLHERTARGIYLFGGCVLVTRAGDEPFWILPGGHVDPGEHSAQALRREWQEEVGVPLANIVRVSTVESSWRRGGLATGDVVCEHCTLYRVTLSRLLPEGIFRRNEPQLRFRWAILGNLIEEQVTPLAVIPWIWQVAGRHYGR